MKKNNKIKSKKMKYGQHKNTHIFMKQKNKSPTSTKKLELNLIN